MTATASSLTYDDLKKLIDGDTVAIRGVATLEPAGGPGDKIFPPTHAVDDKNKRPEAGAKYAFETRRIGGRGSPGWPWWTSVSSRSSSRLATN